MKITVPINGESHEIDASEIQLPEGHQIIDTSNPPKGLFTQAALDQKIKDRLSKEPDKLKTDKDFHKEILNQYNIVLDSEGNPKGLKPVEDIDEVRKEVSKQVSQKYEGKLEELEGKLNSRNKSVIESAIMSAASGTWKDHWTKSYDGSQPLIVKNFADRFTVDEDGREVALDENGNKMFKGNGEPVRAKDYLADDSKFGEEFRDTRQRSSGFQNGASPGSVKRIKSKELHDMSDAEYEKVREGVLKGEIQVD